MIGTRLSHFRIVAKLGEGGMGVVYRAEDERLRRPVALKVLPAELVSNEERRLRFMREARAAAAVSHPNIAAIYEVDEAEGVVFIAMELVEGKTLREIIGGEPMAIKEALRIAAEMAEGLAHAHQARVIHRDLKPDNVMVRPDQHVKILDFGLAKLVQEVAGVESSEVSKLETISGEVTRAGRVMGTPAYMSPEQARGQPVDARSDIFAFGSTLYEMAAGRLPFQGKTSADTLSAILRDELVPPSRWNAEVPAELERIISGCLEKDPTDRFQHADQLVVDLRKLMRTTGSGAQAARAPGEAIPAERARLWARPRRRAGWATVTGLGAALVAAAAAIYWRWTASAPGVVRGDRVIVADFENSTGRVGYDTAIRDAFEHMLSSSAFTEVVRGEELRGLLKDKTGTSVARVDVNTARRLCADGGCAGFFAGRTELEGSGLRINVALHPTASNAPAITRSASIAGEPDILTAVHDLVLGIRRDLGEVPGAVSCTPPPTTRSLEAYQAYALGEGMKAGGMGIFYKADEVLTLFTHAIELDDGFVDAYRGLASSYGHLGDRHSSYRFAEEAYRRSEGLPDQTRLLSEIQFLVASYQYDAAVERLKSYIRLCPFDFSVHETLGSIYFTFFEDPVSAEKHFRASLDLQPERGGPRALCYSLVAQGKAAEIDSVIANHHSWRSYEAELAECAVWATLARDDIPKALEAIEVLERMGPPLSELAGYRRVVALERSGRLEEARKSIAVAMRQPVKIGWLFGRLWSAQDEVWLEMRRTGKAPPLPAWVADYASSDLSRLRELARFSVEVGLADPLALVITRHAADLKGSKSRFVTEQLAFARGCLALVRGAPERARATLEPLARATEIPAYHHVLGRTYEALRMWREAAAEYEDVLKKFYYYRMKPAIWTLDKFRLAHAYDRVGNSARARHWYERFLEDWKDADPDIPELIEARQRLAALGVANSATR